MLIMAVVCFMGALCFSVEARLNSGGLSGELYADVFGDVYVQKNAAFGVGKVNSSGQSGVLHADVFGDVYVGDSPFPVGKVNSGGRCGNLHVDAFGEVYGGDSPFPVDVSRLFVN